MNTSADIWVNVTYDWLFMDITWLNVMYVQIYVTLEHKTSHKGQFCEIEIYASYESWINNLSIDVWFVMIGQYL